MPFHSLVQISKTANCIVYQAEDENTKKIAIKMALDSSNHIRRIFNSEFCHQMALTQEKVKHIVPAISLHKTQHNNFYYIAMDFMENGSLGKYIKNDKILPLDQRVKIMHDIAEGLQDIHALNRVHRDIKSDNIFLDGKLDAFIGDFGHMRFYSENVNGYQSPSCEITCCTPGWTDPVVFTHNEPKLYTEKFDVYSAAVVYWQVMFWGTLDVENSTGDEAYNTKVNRIVVNAEPSENCPAQAVEIIRWCSKQNPEERPNFKEIVQTIKKFQLALFPLSKTITSSQSQNCHALSESSQNASVMLANTRPSIEIFAEKNDWYAVKRILDENTRIISPDKILLLAAKANQLPIVERLLQIRTTSVSFSTADTFNYAMCHDNAELVELLIPVDNNFNACEKIITHPNFSSEQKIKLAQLCFNLGCIPIEVYAKNVYCHLNHPELDSFFLRNIIAYLSDEMKKPNIETFLNILTLFERHKKLNFLSKIYCNKHSPAEIINFTHELMRKFNNAASIRNMHDALIEAIKESTKPPKHLILDINKIAKHHILCLKHHEVDKNIDPVTETFLSQHRQFPFFRYFKTASMKILNTIQTSGNDAEGELNKVSQDISKDIKERYDLSLNFSFLSVGEVKAANKM